MTFYDLQITKQDEHWLYPQMIQAIKKVAGELYYPCLFAYKVASLNELQVLYEQVISYYI